MKGCSGASARVMALARRRRRFNRLGVGADQVTVGNGYYKFDINFSDPACPSGLNYVVEVVAPDASYVPGVSLFIPPTSDVSTLPFNVPACLGTGTDAAPYFRVFNPILQGKKHDPEGVYIKRWVPELASLNEQLEERNRLLEKRLGDALEQSATQELVEQIAVGRVDFNAVETGALSIDRAVAELVDNIRHLLGPQRSWLQHVYQA